MDIPVCENTEWRSFRQASVTRAKQAQRWVQRAMQGLEAVSVIRSGILTIAAFTAKRDEQKMSEDCTAGSPTYV